MAPLSSPSPERRKKPIPIMEKATRLLAMRALSEAELRMRLLRAGYPAAEVRETVAECLRRGYLNDELLAADCAGLCRERGLGARAVRFKLRRRGIAAPTVDGVFAAEEGDAELAAARRAAASKAPSLARESDPRKRREKLLRFLASRGFSAETARKVLEESRQRESDGAAEEETFIP